ncbi:hypothetical protein [Epibacterium ulvae]|uniref:hypothetical protein n=1 Tax=Epibacterium ulvae TaxID=1156985 RepID=UPI000C21E076|nr:hypothetical protein [Epibacterium ulvae]
MNTDEIIKNTPIEVKQSVRPDKIRGLTSCKAGKIVPLAYVPLLREDRVSTGQYRIRLEMMETAEMLMNAINVTCYAHFIPFLAFDRFNGMDHLNRAYSRVPEADGNVTDFFVVEPFNPDSEIHSTMGIHQGIDIERDDDGNIVSQNPRPCNTTIVEAYNVLVNHRRKARSKFLPLREINDHTLASAFWKHRMSDIVPDYDQAAIDGEVPLQLDAKQLPVKGIGFINSVGGNLYGKDRMRQTGGILNKVSEYWEPTSHSRTYVKTDRKIGETFNPNDVLPDIYAELQGQGITLSLSNIELAKKTAAFAKLRSQFDGIDDDHIIDLLMGGVRVPNEQLSQPILLDRKSTIIGYSRRFATDAANLDKSATTGETFVDMRFRTPPMNTGGVILITCEIVPELLYEREKDYFFNTQRIGRLPEFVRDYLDPEKVEQVTKSHLDVQHSDKEGTFGYAPLNYRWRRDLVRIGGKYRRPLEADQFDENRQKIWSNEVEDPEYNEDFILANNLHHNVFADQNSDPFEITTIGGCQIVGNTVFGKGLEEASDDYDEILDQVRTHRIDKSKTRQENTQDALKGN